jgi:DNA-binding HxlR family transcriptional regulator
MTTGSYQQFCPVAMAAEILCTRWTIVVLREMFAGSTRFNELRRGVPRMSPALLSRRLKELEGAGIVAREASASDSGVFEYQLTESGRELGPLVEAFGIWGQRRIESNLSLQHLDVDLLMCGTCGGTSTSRQCLLAAAWWSSSIRNCQPPSDAFGSSSIPRAALTSARSISDSKSTSMFPRTCAA